MSHPVPDHCVQAIILAGQRPGPDALCGVADVDYKADIPIHGIAMLDRVAGALRDADLSEPFMLSGYAPHREGYVQIDGGEGPADSALLAARAADTPVLLTTCDHALLTQDIVRDFLRDSKATQADATVGLATRPVIEADYPETRRTYMNFSDHSVSGCNLFYLRNAAGLAAIEFWRDAQHLRKKPLRLALKIGPIIALRFLFGRLSLQDAFDYASRRIGIRVAPVLLNHAEAAIDVDSPSDLELVRRIIANRAPE